MASTGKPDKEVIRNWLQARRGSTAPPPAIEQIQAEVYRQSPSPVDKQGTGSPARQKWPFSS